MEGEQSYSVGILTKQFYFLSISADEVAARNMRPQSREISLEEEKAAVLEEMRKVSESSDE